MKRQIVMSIADEPMGEIVRNKKYDQDLIHFHDFLVKKYSFKTVWDFMYNESDYHNTFGQSYDSLKKEWMKEIL